MQALDLDRLAAARSASERLHRLLEEEFIALRDQSLTRFEQLQVPKAQLLAELSEVIAVHRSLVEQAFPLPSDWLAAWDTFRTMMLDCRDLHRRNELLILRKREAIQGALSALVGSDNLSASVDIYDRLGKIRRSPRSNAYSQA
ncbi:MAG: hypothetical protein RL322_2403 [Pseudomonadota bacterium]|jgi:flagellar biosynthesis/type III secretory pathway chaperone